MNMWLILAGVFTGTAMLTLLIFAVVSSSFSRVNRRLKTMNADARVRQEPTWGEHSERFPRFALLLGRTGQYGTLERLLGRAGLNWQPGEYVAAWTAGAVVLAVFGWLLQGPWVTAAVVVLAVVGAWMTLVVRQNLRMRQFELQLSDALMLMASSLRSGYGILRSIQAIRDEMKPPIALEFAKVLDETAVGLGIPEALVNLVQRVPLPDLDIAVTAILLHLEVGGNLAEVIEIVAATVRERQRIRNEVDVLTAEGRLSGIILFLLPVALGCILTVLNPAYMASLFHTPIGHLLLIAAGVLQVIGGLLIMRMLEVDF